tara:strand:+ start:59 stop:220 length:162 start_codon:yes stop_codon:yes gene_type:complete
MAWTINEDGTKKGHDSKKKQWEYDPSLGEVNAALNRKRKDQYQFKAKSKIKYL